MNVQLKSLLIGGGITLCATVLAHWLLASREDRKHQKTLNGVLQGIHDELETLWTTYKAGMGDRLEKALKDNKPFWGYYPLTQEYCTIYTENASLIGQIKDRNLRKAIVTTYLKFKVVVDSYKVHNWFQEEFIKWDLLQRQTDNVSDKENARVWENEVIQHTRTLKKHHDKWKENVEELLKMLRCATESSVIPISKAKRIKRFLKKIL